MFFRIVGLLIWILARLLLWTIRYRVEGLENYSAEGAKIFAIFHNAIFFAIGFKVNKRLCTVASLSKDGELIYQVLKHLPFYKIVRGSSTRGGVLALKGMIREIENGADTVVTVDGPKGPKYQVKPGVIQLAKKTSVKVVPIALACRTKITLNSWDRFQIPCPFTTCQIIFGAPQLIAKDTTDKAFEEMRAALENKLLELTEFVTQRLQRKK